MWAHPRRVPVRVAQDDGRLHRPHARGVCRRRRRPAPQDRLDRPQEPRRRLAVRRCGRARRRADVAAVPQEGRRRHRAGRVDAQGARRHSARAPRRHLHHVRRPVRRAVHASRADATSTWATRCTSGLFVCSHNPKVPETAVFSNVRIVVPPKAGWTPYRDYIGSNLEIMTVATGARTVLHTSPISLQAPNWTTDGKALIYNSAGKLYRFDLATRAVTEINTGFATRNNNDHVLSFDGTHAGHQPSQRRRQRPVGHLHAARRRRHAEAHHRQLARRTSTAGRRTASGSSTPACATARSTSTRSRRTAATRSG